MSPKNDVFLRGGGDLMSKRNKAFVVAGGLVLLLAMKFLPVTIEFFQQREGPFEESVLQAFDVDVQSVNNVQMTFYKEGEFNAESKNDYAPVLEYLLSLNASSVFPQSSIVNCVSEQIIFLDFPGGSLSMYLLDDHHFAVWSEDKKGYTIHHVYKTNEVMGIDFLRSCLNNFF